MLFSLRMCPRNARDRARLHAAIGLLALLAACAGEHRPPGMRDEGSAEAGQSSQGEDASRSQQGQDASAPGTDAEPSSAMDAATLDASLDANTVDAGSNDASSTTQPDAAPAASDAGNADTGADAASDAGLDAGPPDANDAAALDANAAADTATPTDASAASDASTDAGDSAGPRPSCDLVVELRAHGAQTLGDTTPFVLQGNGDHYETFWFAPSWNSKMHVIDVEPLVGGEIARSWWLYMKSTGSEVPGSHAPGSGLQSSSTELLATWAQEVGSMPIPADVGIKVVEGAQARFALEMHYKETGDTVEQRSDRSGVRLCLSQQLRAKEAGLHWLGTLGIFGVGGGGTVNAVGTCTTQNVAHALAYAPYMRGLGKHIKVVVAHDDDTRDVLADREVRLATRGFTALPNEMVIRPGDVVTTTCTYANTRPFTFGPGVNDEMCFAFVLAWPAGSLSNGSVGVVGGKNTCIDN